MPPELHRRSSFLFVLFILCFSHLSAQLKPTEALSKLYNDYPQEKIYTWLNKPGFIAGETAWFKIYVFSGYDLSHISSNLYVELLNSDKKSISRKRYALMNGLAQGSIDLDSSLNEGVYYLRAYTDWMLNYDEQFQYIKQIPVYNLLSKMKLAIADAKWEVGAFPEGGNLIDGFETKVAVRLFSNGALPENWNGHVEDETGTMITSLKVLDPNVALFTIKPEIGKKYKVFVSDNTGKKNTSMLPEVKTSGALMNVVNYGDSVLINLRFKNTNGGAGYSVIGHIQNQLVYEGKIKSSSAFVNQTIKTSDYLNGILHLTLFDPDNKPVSERLVFLNPSKLIYDTTVNVDLTFDPSSRSKNELTITTDSINWNSYAIKITDDDLPNEKDEETILSNLWLTSDLLNPIYDPSSFFSSPDPKKIMALDAIMISEKWQRFKWENILLSRFPEIKYKPQNYLTFTGTVSSKKEIPYGEGLSMLLGNPGSPSQVLYTTVDSGSRINVDNIIFAGDFFSYYRLNNGRKWAGRKIDIDFTRTDIYLPYTLPLPSHKYVLLAKPVDSSQPLWVQHSYSALQSKKAADDRYKTLQEVIIRSSLKTKKEQLHDRLVTGQFRISNENIFDFVNEKQNALGLPSIFHWLQTRVSGLEVLYNAQEGEWVPVYKRSSGFTPKRILLYLNEGESSPSWINFIPLDNIIMIKVITHPRTLAFGSDIGMVISVYTERDSIIAAERDVSLNNKLLKGYDVTKEYTIPQYDNTNLAFPEEDRRSELLWQPVLLPGDSLFTSKVKFFNNNTVKKVRIMIQGFNNEGFPVYINRVISSEAIKPF